MKNMNRLLASSSLVVVFMATGMASSSSFAETSIEKKDLCPSYLVNFWKNYAADTNNPEAIPAFLVKNECLRINTSKAFHYAMEKRLDEPEVDAHVEALYAQLSWTDGYQ